MPYLERVVIYRNEMEIIDILWFIFNHDFKLELIIFSIFSNYILDVGGQV